MAKLVNNPPTIGLAKPVLFALTDAGFRFEHPMLDDALRFTLGR